MSATEAPEQRYLTTSEIADHAIQACTADCVRLAIDCAYHLGFKHGEAHAKRTPPALYTVPQSPVVRLDP